jgi:hypothetical protein
MIYTHVTSAAADVTSPLDALPIADPDAPTRPARPRQVP